MLSLKRLDTLQHVGVYALLAGGALFVGEMAVPGLKPYGKYVKLLVIGGAVLFVVGMVV